MLYSICAVKLSSQPIHIGQPDSGTMATPLESPATGIATATSVEKFKVLLGWLPADLKALC